MELRLCDQPWFELQLEYSRATRCCCYYHGDEVDWTEGEGPFDIQGLWNSSAMREKRSIIASNRAEGTGCDGCLYLNFATGPRFADSPPDWLNEKQRRNYDKAIANFRSKRIEVDSLPTKIYINFGLACNLDCIMCSQTPDREGIKRGRFHEPRGPAKGSEAPKNTHLFSGNCAPSEVKRDERQVPVDKLLASKDALLHACTISVIGGEPLAVPNSRKFIEAIGADPDFSNILLEIYTNGTLLSRFTDKMRNIQRIALAVSLDSSDPLTYEYVRRGSRWDNVERNLLHFKEFAARENLNWTVNISGLVMKSTIKTLPVFAEWCARNDFPAHFWPMMRMTHAGLNTDSEDVYNFPELLEEIPDWEDKFDSAIDILSAKGWPTTGLRTIRNDLKNRVDTHWMERWRANFIVRVKRSLANYPGGDVATRALSQLAGRLRKNIARWPGIWPPL